MAVIFLKSGGTVSCGGYTIKNGAVKAIGPEFKDTPLPADKAKQIEADIPLENILFIVPGKI